MEQVAMFEGRLREELLNRGVNLVGVRKPLFEGEVFGVQLPENAWYVLAQTQKVATSLMIPSYILADGRAAIGIAEDICASLDSLAMAS